jgi:glycosyltransferase involved in cell wall biosynthesis
MSGMGSRGISRHDGESEKQTRTLSSMNRFLTIMTLISGDGRAGADKLAFDIAVGLRRLGHRVIWGCPSHYYLMDEAKARGLEVHILDFSSSMDMTSLPVFMNFCRNEKVDIVKVHHSHGRHLIVVARLLGLKAKAIFMRHCISGSMPYVGAFFYNLFGVSIAVSEAVRRSLLLGGVLPSRVKTVYGGINVNHFETVPEDKVEKCREQYGRRGVFTIGIVARLGLYKGFRTDKPTMKRHEVLFRALASLKEDFHLLVLGAEEKYLRIIAEDNGLDPEKITFCGFEKEIASFYKIMDLSVLPSPNEGLGLAIIEAMAAGVACIGADSGGIREIITDGVNGFLFEPGNSDDLARKIRLIMANKEVRDSVVLHGRRKVRHLFTIEKTVFETEKLFYDIVGLKPQCVLEPTCFRSVTSRSRTDR